jgi:hypothetical protein
MKVRFLTQGLLAGLVATLAVVLFYTLPAVKAAPGQDASMLLAGHIVTGTVLDSDNKPVANVPVKLLAPSKAKGGPARIKPGGSPTGDSGVGTPRPNDLQNAPGTVGKDETVAQSSSTDSAGKFTFRNVNPGEYQIMAGSGNKAGRSAVTVGDKDPQPITVQIPK